MQTMEWLWFIIAALGAGVGTGLAGLSAATVMVPILIVLCPSFAGETGAYQATAIALASDILGSAVTALTYARNKNIDLRRGWIMMVCIWAMSTVGSYAAYRAGNVVLGGFTLLLTFCIGIRFLVKPDTSRADGAAKGARLDAKGIAISLFFGLTIGFGTGFVGTGGGMMMLVVFTAFLGMELKCAVGTSTFIMTFTALIASVSHIFIHPAIIAEKWPVMLLCIVVATAASLVSARFANRVSSRTVGRVTGVVLTLLGASMIVLRYGDTLARALVALGVLLLQILHCLWVLALYIVPSVIVLVLIRVFTKVPSFVFRKMLHVVAFTCVSLMILEGQSWQAAALASVMLAAIIYPLLGLIEGMPWYAGMFVEKEPGEIRQSMLMLFLMFAALITVSWGIFGQRHLAAAAILMWGVGDAVAALVGIPFGRHKVHLPLTDGKKSWEGSGAMLGASFVCGIIMLLGVQHMVPVGALVCAGAGALVGSATELFTPSKYDTVTVPMAIVAVLLLVAPLF